MLSVQANRFVRRSLPFASRCFSTAKMQKEGGHIKMQDMKQSKNQFVKFVNRAALDETSGEKQELYQFLVECFVDNDTDYDGEVSFKGFNNMIAEAAMVPRRFGFAPHTRELYFTKEHYDAEREALFNALRGDGERVQIQAWLSWANAHVKEKVGMGLEEHEEPRWERSKQDYIGFLKGVMKARSSHQPKSSTSTQLKEHYMNSVRQFCAADKEAKSNGKLDPPAFLSLLSECAKCPAKHGLTLYTDVKFEDVSTDGKTVSLTDFLDWKIGYLRTKLAHLVLEK